VVVAKGGTWRLMRRRLTLLHELAQVIPPGAPLVLVDDGTLGAEQWAIPFLERDGVYWGRPADDATAIAELERLRASGARFIAFAWPAFWWLDHYAGFHRHLRSRYRCRLESRTTVVFDVADARATTM
jgi:hypothetical protein